ncbi:hypothetical protein GCM10023310_69550 [Paenibacillus vulneris]
MTRVRIDLDSFYYLDPTFVVVRDETNKTSHTYSLKYYDVYLNGVLWESVMKVK